MPRPGAVISVYIVCCILGLRVTSECRYCSELWTISRLKNCMNHIIFLSANDSHNLLKEHYFWYYDHEDCVVLWHTEMSKLSMFKFSNILPRKFVIGYTIFQWKIQYYRVYQLFSLLWQNHHLKLIYLQIEPWEDKFSHLHLCSVVDHFLKIQCHVCCTTPWIVNMVPN